MSRTIKITNTGIVCALILFISACSSSTDAPIITNLEATYTNLYPSGKTDIRCEAKDLGGDTLIYRWSSTGGSFTGTGSVITWNAPNNYGDYHIMVSVKNSKGGVAQKTLTISVVSEQEQQGCSTCGR